MSEQALPPSPEAVGSDRRSFFQALTAAGGAFALTAASEQPAAAQQLSSPKPLGTVRISLPASVAFNLNSLQSTIQTVLGKIGCQACFSGADCQFVQEREFIVDSPAGGITVSVGEISTAATPQNTAVIGFGGPASASISSVLKAVANVAGALGCTPCHSGFDVSFVNEVILLGVTQSLAIQKFGVLG